MHPNLVVIAVGPDSRQYFDAVLPKVFFNLVKL